MTRDGTASAARWVLLLLRGWQHLGEHFLLGGVAQRAQQRVPGLEPDWRLRFLLVGQFRRPLAVPRLDLLAQADVVLASFRPGVAARLGIGEERVEKLVTACAAIDLIKREGAMISNAEDVDRFLVRGKPTYFGGYLLHFAKGSYPLWGRVGRVEGRLRGRAPPQ